MYLPLYRVQRVLKGLGAAVASLDLVVGEMVQVEKLDGKVTEVIDYEGRNDKFSTEDLERINHPFGIRILKDGNVGGKKHPCDENDVDELRAVSYTRIISSFECELERNLTAAEFDKRHPGVEFNLDLLMSQWKYFERQILYITKLLSILQS